MSRCEAKEESPMCSVGFGIVVSNILGVDEFSPVLYRGGFACSIIPGTSCRRTYRTGNSSLGIGFFLDS